MKKNVLSYWLVIWVCFWSNVVLAQTQKGQDIDGENSGDNSGQVVSMPDAQTLAIGAPKNDGNGGNAGHVRVFTWSGSAWIPKGNDIDGDAAGDLFGSALCMPTPNVVAVGAPRHDQGDVDAGQVKVMQWDGNSWQQKGQLLVGDSTPAIFGGMFGSSLSMPDANTLAVGAPWYDTTGTFSGQVKVYDWQANSWVQRGSSITGPAFSYTGSLVCMPSVNVLAVVTQGATVANKGMVRVYAWDGTLWAPKGDPIEGEMTGDLAGSSLSMPDENTLALGAVDNDGSFPQAGHVRVFSWNGTDWVQKGSDIDGEAAGEASGNAIHMPDANTLAVGASLSSESAVNSGQVRIYGWNGNDWIKLGTNINGEAARDESGFAVSMPDANTVAIGAIKNDAVNGSQFANEAGHVRVFELASTTGFADLQQAAVLVYPNPAADFVTIEGEKVKSVQIYNPLGVLVDKFEQTNRCEISHLPGGWYTLHIQFNNGALKVEKLLIKH
jgi:hypothetical protein